MIKLNHEKELKDKHHDYLKKNLLPKIKQAKRSPFKIPKKSLNKIICSLNNNYPQNKFKRKFKYEQLRFYDYIEYNLKDIAIGEPSKLKELHLEMESNFELLMKVLSSRPVDVTFSNHIYNLFGYENFKTDTLFNLFKIAAKMRAGGNLKNKFSYKHREEFKYLLAAALPDKKKEIYSILSNKNCPDLKSFEERFYSIPDVHMTLSNVKESQIFMHGWSDYALVMSSNIRVCPYCNRQFVTPFISSKGRIRADLDHFLSKLMYPYFSMSLFNLIPSCKQCNQGLKGEKEFPIDGLHPFQDNIHHHFTFTAIPQPGKGLTEINVKIDDSSQSNIEDFIDMFKLKPLYGYHSNQADEIITKRQMYPDKLLQSLLPKSPFTSIDDLKSFIVGYEIDEQNLNNEPLSKLRHDIAIQVGLLPKKVRIAEDLLNQLKTIT
ncbi:hypothetical protein [Exiguobacterium sp. S22-S28]|uniref:hypothetical protein n=1 Tax=Exiguobacterium sp. S22-S28 TaxID=3342768 RepID=UPI00372D09FB